MKEMTLHAPCEAVQTLARIIEDYVDAAYPSGGSECAQSAREALLLTAQRMKNEYDAESGSVRISRRVKAHIKSAVKYYLQSQGDSPDAVHKSECLLQCINGVRLNLNDWQA